MARTTLGVSSDAGRPRARGLGAAGSNFESIGLRLIDFNYNITIKSMNDSFEQPTTCRASRLAIAKRLPGQCEAANMLHRRPCIHNKIAIYSKIAIDNVDHLLA